MELVLACNDTIIIKLALAQSFFAKFTHAFGFIKITTIFIAETIIRIKGLSAYGLGLEIGSGSAELLPLAELGLSVGPKVKKSTFYHLR